MNGAALGAAVAVAGCLLAAAAMVLRAARVHAAAVSGQRPRRPFPELPEEYQPSRPEQRRPRRRGRLVLLAALAAAAAYWYAAPAVTTAAARVAHGHAGVAPALAGLIIAAGLAGFLGWSLSRRRYPRDHGW